MPGEQQWRLDSPATNSANVGLDLPAAQKIPAWNTSGQALPALLAAPGRAFMAGQPLFIFPS
jgi:hypothetical protein